MTDDVLKKRAQRVLVFAAPGLEDLRSTINLSAVDFADIVDVVAKQAEFIEDLLNCQKLNIGPFEITKYTDEVLSITRDEGEGGNFNLDRFRMMVEEFYKKEF